MFLMAVCMIFKYSKRFRYAPSFNNLICKYDYQNFALFLNGYNPMRDAYSNNCNKKCSINIKQKNWFLVSPKKASPRFSGLLLALGDLVDSRWVLEKIKQSFKLLSKISLHLKPLCRQSSLKLKGYFF